MFKPPTIRLEASTACQLRCPACATTQGKIDRALGTGFLAFDDFRNLIEANPWIRHVELSNWGEIFLNPDLIRVMEFAFAKSVGLFADNGVNLNNASEAALEGLVRYQFQRITCAIDGASSETYAVYRKKGNFERVIENIRTINEFKTQHGSDLPALTWQFIPFAHNEHEIEKARELASALGMEFYIKLAWDDLFDRSETFAPVRDKVRIREESGLGVADRNEFRERFGDNYLQKSICGQLWTAPQINWDGRVLGCCLNYWGDFGNAFSEGLLESLNNEKINHAREMLQGLAPERSDIPCTACPHYKTMKANGRWIRPKDFDHDR